MQIEQMVELSVETIEMDSEPLERVVRTDIYTVNITDQTKQIDLLLINDGQDLVTMNFASILQQVNSSHPLRPLVIAAIHCGDDRRNEYGTAAAVDYKGRGAKAGAYEHFILLELMPVLFSRLTEFSVREISFAGFSLGGLSAMDIVWRHPNVFTKAGVFSGSFWWRTRSHEEKEYNPTTDRVMHNQIRNGEFHPNLRFFFQCGTLDEVSDRNGNGVIDSIDDTIDLMRELLRKGYKEGKDFVYLQLREGKHDVFTWAKAMPAFLKWGWAK
jgi:enterochelin esterase-like enzyme